jgi:hypothetical protein
MKKMYKGGNPKIPHVFKSCLLMDSAAFVCKVAPFSNLWKNRYPTVQYYDSTSIILDSDLEQSFLTQENKLECRGGRGGSQTDIL